MREERQKRERQKRDNFKKIAEKRTEVIIEKIRSLSKTSNTSHYSYDDREVSKMFNAIMLEISLAKSKFKRMNKHNNNTFKF